MNKIHILLVFLFSFGISFSQEELSQEEKERREKNIQAGNPFAKFGYKAKVATLSKGKYLEFHDLDSIVTIGSVRFHVDKMQIVGHVERDTLNPDAQPLGDTTGRWLSPDPLSEEYPDWTPYRFAFNNPLRYTDPTGLIEEDWIPDFEITKDSKGNTSGARLIAKMENSDTPETLAKFLSINLNEANQLFSDMKSSNSSSIVVPESIAGEINETMSNAIMNPNSYKQGFFSSKNYNCFEMTSSLSKGKTPDYSNIMAPYHFSSELKRDYEHATSSEYRFGSTSIRFGEDQKNILGMTSNISTHAAIYLGTSSNGTIYTFSKNGMQVAPDIFTLSNLESMYSKNQGVGPTKNESGFYNYRN